MTRDAGKRLFACTEEINRMLSGLIESLKQKSDSGPQVSK